MARIEGVDLPRNKRVEVGLTYIYGIGLPSEQKVLSETGVNPDTRVKDLTDAEVNLLRDYISSNYKVEGDLRREVQLNIKRLIEIGSYRGLRHRRNLPVRGHNTRTNARTRKGPKKTAARRQEVITWRGDGWQAGWGPSSPRLSGLISIRFLKRLSFFGSDRSLPSTI